MRINSYPISFVRARIHKIVTKPVFKDLAFVARSRESFSVLTPEKPPTIRWIGHEGLKLKFTLVNYTKTPFSTYSVRFVEANPCNLAYQHCSNDLRQRKHFKLHVFNYFSCCPF